MWVPFRVHRREALDRGGKDRSRGFSSLWPVQGDPTWLYRGYVGIMEKIMETTISQWGIHWGYLQVT